MDLLNLIFKLGVLFSIYGFLWFFIDLGLTFLAGGKKRTTAEIYLLKGIKYAFLVNVTFLFSVDHNKHHINFYNLMPSALILITYFIGMLQQKTRQQIFMGQLTKSQTTVGSNIKSEIFLIALCSFLFFGLLWYPQFAENAVALWFQKSILDIESTVIIGFIFKIIGFFFLLGMIFKMLNALNYLISGKPLFDIKSRFSRTNEEKNDKHFDDFEELT
jgi:hypothetical protein